MKEKNGLLGTKIEVRPMLYHLEDMVMGIGPLGLVCLH